MCLPHHGKITSHRFSTNTMTGMHTFSASNTPAITPLARRQASLPMKCRSDTYCAPPSPSLIAPTVEPHQSFDCDHLAYCDFARERQQRAYELVHEQHALTVARVNGRNFTPSDVLLRDILILGIWQPAISSARDRINSCMPTQPRARSPSPKVNITLREPTDSSLTMFIAFASCPLHAPCGSWCLQTHGRYNPLQGVLHG